MVKIRHFVKLGLVLIFMKHPVGPQYSVVKKFELLEQVSDVNNKTLARAQDEARILML